MRLPDPTKNSTKYGKLDETELVKLGRTELERLAKVVARVDGRFSEHNLEVLRRAWKLARADKAEALERAESAVAAAKAVGSWRESLNGEERRLGGEGRDGNFDAV